MENKNNRVYDKAIKNCEKGKIDKALKICEEGIANNLNDAKLLNLKGLLLYEKGQLNEAVTVWKLNMSLNNNEEAKIYVKGSENDVDKLYIYDDACKYLRSGNIDKALELYLKCNDSDFNCIKVNTKISICYEKKGYYYKSMEYIEKVLKVDSNSEEAKKIKEKLLIRLKEDYNQDYTSRKKLAVVTAFIVIIAVCAGGYSIRNKVLLNKTQESVENTTDNNAENSKEETGTDINQNTEDATANSDNTSVNTSTDASTTNDEENTVKFDHDTVSSLVENKNFEELYKVLTMANTDNLNDYDKELFYKAEKLMQSEGVRNFYQIGLNYYKEENYTDSIANFDKAYKYCSESYLRPHVIFYRGTAASNINKKDITEAMYEEYSNEYPDGSYIEGVLYELALLSDKNGNTDKANKYAKELIDKFPNSIYINNKINELAQG